MIRSYRDLRVWRRSMDLAVLSYRATDGFPASERYDLACQVKRAAVSIPANIAEGQGREHLGDYVRHLSIANGSLKELETHILLALRLGFLTRDETRVVIGASARVGKMLTLMIRRLKLRKDAPRTATQHP